MRHYCYFNTSIGSCGLLWNEHALERLQLPEKSPAATRRRLTEGSKPCQELPWNEAPPWVQDAVLSLQNLLAKGQADLASLPIDLSACSPFFRLVYEAARDIPAGQTSSYGALAKAAGSPAAFRAVGQAMGRNPLPLIIPCHRVLAAGNKPGGFTAFGGLVTKRQLLAIEMAGTLNWEQDFAGSAAQALTYVQEQDATLSPLIERVGACGLKPQRAFSLFTALSRAIVYQQLHGKAAATIFQRFRALFPNDDMPSPEAVLDTSDETLRGAGLSRSKIASIKDLALKIHSGILPSREQLDAMDDAAIIKALTQVRGIGPWTVEMLLIFDLGRLDILPVTDYGVRKGFAVAYRKRELPSPEALRRYGERWKPFRSLVSWYLWQAADSKNP